MALIHYGASINRFYWWDDHVESEFAEDAVTIHGHLQKEDVMLLGH